MSRFPSVWRICRPVCLPRQNDVPGGQLTEVEENMTGLVSGDGQAGWINCVQASPAVHGRDARATNPFERLPNPAASDLLRGAGSAKVWRARFNYGDRCE